MTRVIIAAVWCLAVIGASAWMTRPARRMARACVRSGLLPLILAGGVAQAGASEKLVNLPDAKLLSIVSADITERQALATADFTREIYSEGCTFTDEIDTYAIDDYVRGTKALFNGPASHVALASAPQIAPDGTISYRFKETLAFKIPYLAPKVDLAGRVELKRGSDGLISSSREFWDDSVAEVLQHVYF